MHPNRAPARQLVRSGKLIWVRRASAAASTNTRITRARTYLATRVYLYKVETRKCSSVAYRRRKRVEQARGREGTRESEYTASNTFEFTRCAGVVLRAREYFRPERRAFSAPAGAVCRRCCCCSGIASFMASQTYTSWE